MADIATDFCLMIFVWDSKETCNELTDILY